MKKFTTFNLVIIAMMAALGIATKPLIVPLVHLITGPLFIPGGAIAGGFYMMWIVLGAALIDKRGAATLISIVQAIMVTALGIYGTHGVVSLLTYIVPGIGVDLVFMAMKRSKNVMFKLFLAGIVANICGTYLVNIVFFKLPLIPLILSLASAALSGGLGGLIAYGIFKRLNKFGIMENEGDIRSEG